MSDVQVKLVCVEEGKKLRVRIVTRGYNNNANVQFPRAIRKAGRFYTAPADAIILKFGPAPNKKPFYYVTPKSVTVVPEESEAVCLEDLKIFEVDPSPDCCVCMSEEKTIVFAPCGHYCTCAECAQSIDDKCPICRQKILAYVMHSEMI